LAVELTQDIGDKEGHRVGEHPSADGEYFEPEVDRHKFICDQVAGN